MGVFEDSVATFLAPVKDYLADDSVSEVLVNGPNEIFIERRGLLERVPEVFKDEQALQAAIRNIAQFVGRRIDEEIPSSTPVFPMARVSPPSFLPARARARPFQFVNFRKAIRASSI